MLTGTPVGDFLRRRFLSHFLTVQFHFPDDLLPQFLLDVLPDVFLPPQIVPDDF